MNCRPALLCGLAVVVAMITDARARDFEMGGDQFPYSIMTPEPGTVHDRATVSRRMRHVSTSRRPVRPVVMPTTRPNRLARRGSSGLVLPTPLPRTTLIPPEGGSPAAVHPLPQERGPTFVPGLKPIPNLPHGAETFQDRAARCSFQQGLYGVPATASTQYMGACLQ